MALSLVFFGIFSTLYILLIGLCIYYCNFANPNTNTIAHMIHVTIPQHITRTLQKICPPFLLQILNVLLIQNLFVLLYLCMTLGCWSIVFFYIYPWMTQQHHHLLPLVLSSSSSATTAMEANHIIIIPLYHQYIGVIVFIICMMTYRIATQSSPGLISSTKAVPYYNHYPYDEYMYNPPPSPLPTATTTTNNNTNATASNNSDSNTRSNDNNRNTDGNHHQKHLKLARSKYDRMKYHYFVPKYDHYCYWMNNTFGEENYRYFLLFLFVHVIMCIYGCIIIGILFYNDIYIIHQLHLRTFIDMYTKMEIPVTTYVLFQYLVSSYVYEVTVFAVLLVMSITLLLFLGYHVYMITCTGLTSNEMYKWNQIQKWYRSELKLYNQQQQQEKMKILSNASTVTTTTTNNTEELVEHPGPKPINIYNYGVIQNWKHVLFPIPIQKRRRRRQQQLKQQQQAPEDRSHKES